MTLQYNFQKNKKKLRTWAKTQRQSGKFAQQNETILKNIKNFDVFCCSKSVMLFYPLKSEINLLTLLTLPKNYSFPCIIDDKIVPYKNNNEFSKGLFNILEPKNSIEQNINEIDLVIVPALCVDTKGNRVGYGKGYYDRFLKTLNREKTKCIVVIWDAFIVDEIEADIFDEKIDYIITEKRIIKTMV